MRATFVEDPRTLCPSLRSSLFYRTSSYAADDVLLEDKDHYHQRKCYYYRGGGNVAPRDIVYTREVGDTDGNGLMIDVRGKGQSKHKLIPGRDKAKQSRRDNCRQRHRENDPEEDCHWPRPVDTRSLIDGLWNGSEVAEQN